MQETWDRDSIPGLGRSPGGGHGHPFQYPCLENPMDRGAWQATVHRVAKSWTQLKQPMHGCGGTHQKKCLGRSEVLASAEWDGGSQKTTAFILSSQSAWLFWQSFKNNKTWVAKLQRKASERWSHKSGWCCFWVRETTVLRTQGGGAGSSWELTSLLVIFGLRTINQLLGSYLSFTSMKSWLYVYTYVFHKFFLKLFMYLFLVVLGLCCSLWAFSSCGARGYSSLWSAGFSWLWLQLLQFMGSVAPGHVQSSLTRDIEPMYPLHWQADSYPLYHQGSHAFHEFW